MRQCLGIHDLHTRWDHRVNEILPWGLLLGWSTVERYVDDPLSMELGLYTYKQTAVTTMESIRTVQPPNLGYDCGSDGFPSRFVV